MPGLLTKIMRVMRIASFMFLVFAMHVSANGFSQQITYSAKDVTLDKVFSIIREQTGFMVVCNAKLIREARPVTIDARQAPLEQFLRDVLKDQRLDYAIEEQTIVISGKPVFLHEKLPPLSGTTSDTEGNLLAGVTVKVKGTDIGTVSDGAGEYTLDVPSGATLVVSYIGYETQEIKAGNSTTLNIVLKAKVSPLEETIIKGYYATTKKLNTGNLSKVSGKDIDKQPVSNPLAALQGRVSGVEITQISGVPGATFQIKIRGRNSIRHDGNDPLYLVDGVPYPSIPITQMSDVLGQGSSLNALSIGDIESIEILKDADATAIYGSRGANGVVLITTKRGKAGKTQVNVNASQGWSKAGPFMQLLNTQQYLEMRREGHTNSGTTPEDWELDLVRWDQNRYTDWQKELLGGTARTANADVSLSGGNANTRYLLHSAYYRETTVFPGDNAYKKGSVHLNVNHSSDNQKLGANFTVSFVSDRNNLPSNDLTAAALRMPPNAPAGFTEDGRLNWDENTYNNNPYVQTVQKYLGINKNLMANALLTYRLLPSLQLKTSMGYNFQTGSQFSTYPIAATFPSFPQIGGARWYDAKMETWIIEPQIEYKKKIGKNNLNVIAGTTFQDNITNGKGILAGGYTSDALLANLDAATSIRPVGTDYKQYRYNAIFGRISFDHLGKYLLNLTGRRDGSSKFGRGRQFANFGAVGAAWIFTEEPFISDHLPFLSFGKLRGSYGTSGNDQIPHYGYLDSYSPTANPYDDGTAVIPTRLANPDFSWETNRKLEVALEAGFLKDKILLSTSLYRNRSSNQLVGYALSAVTGQTSISANFPATVQNSGLEIELSSTNIKGSAFTWTTAFNITVPDNKLISFPGLANSSYRYQFEEGKSLYVNQRLIFDGVDPATGLYRMRDLDNDNELTEADRVFIETSAQQFYGGLQNTFSYKGLELDFLFQFSKQTGTSFINNVGAPGTYGNQSVNVMERWRKPGDIAPVQQFTTYGTDAYNAYDNVLYYGSNAVVDASFVRLKNVALTWNLPAAWNKRTGIGGKVYVHAQNLLTFTDYFGVDPEVRNTLLPPLRTIVTGIQLTF